MFSRKNSFSRPGLASHTSSNKPAQPESKCPELLANYCDMLLRKTPLSKKLTSDEVEAKLKGKDVISRVFFQIQRSILI